MSEEEDRKIWGSWFVESTKILPKECSSKFVVEGAYRILSHYEIPIDVACEYMLNIYEQEQNMLPLNYKLN